MSATPIRQLALQGAAVILVLSLAWPYYGWQAQAMPWLQTSLTIGAVALAIATLSRQPWWWRLIHGGFMPLIWATQQLAIDPGWFLLGFILLLLVYRGALSGQVPLYLSNPQTVDALDRLIETQEAGSFLDLGAGLGSTLVPLADRWPERRFTGVENAPLTRLGGRLLSLGRPNLDWRWGDLWQTSLAGHDIVPFVGIRRAARRLQRSVGAIVRPTHYLQRVDRVRVGGGIELRGLTPCSARLRKPARAWPAAP